MEYKIMIVEDDASIANLLGSTYWEYGYKTIMVDDFDRILDIFIEKNPHLVLLDINLPRYDGYYWCRKIRQKSRYPYHFNFCPGWWNGPGDGDRKRGGRLHNQALFLRGVVMAKIKSQLRGAVLENWPLMRLRKERLNWQDSSCIQKGRNCI